MDKVWVVFKEIAYEDTIFYGVFSSRRKAWWKMAHEIVGNPFYRRGNKPTLEIYGVGELISYYDNNRMIRWVAHEEEIDAMMPYRGIE